MTIFGKWPLWIVIGILTFSLAAARVPASQVSCLAEGELHAVSVGQGTDDSVLRTWL